MESFFNQAEMEFYAQSGIPQAGAPGKLWEVVQGLWSKGVNPLVIFQLFHTIMAVISQFNTLSVTELVEKILATLQNLLSVK
jgi:hypothetical protein